MSKKKVFVSIFPPAENVHLIKDVGMIPYLLYKNHNYDSYIACYNNGNYQYLQSDVKGLKIEFIKRTFKSNFLNIILFLLSFKKIDVIQLYHYNLQRLVICFLFKLCTFGRGRTYIKLDANEKISAIKYTGYKRILNLFFIKFVDVLSAETIAITRRINKNNSFDKKIEFIPNGFYQIKREKKFEAKKNQCITVGNLDDERKSAITLVEGFGLFCKNNPKTDWEFILIGKYDENFKSKVNGILEIYPEAINKIKLLGQINDRKELVVMYEQSKLFLFASLTESFGFVYLEALANSCFIISTPLEPCREITNNCEFADTFNFKDYKKLANLIEDNTTKVELNEITKRGQNYVFENYYWPIIIGKIAKLLSKY